jgi:TonB-linked SusC/RagA family outer membrane protein
MPLFKLAGCLVGLQVLFALPASAQYAFAGNRTFVNGDRRFSGQTQNEKQALLTVLKELNKEKGVYFLYSEENIGQKLVNPVRDVKADIEKILSDILQNTGLKYKKVSSNTFVILNEEEKLRKADIRQLSTTANSVNNQFRKIEATETITGRIVGADGAPLSDVSVRIKGTSKGTTTNNRGDFSIEANRGDVLIFSYVGYQTQEIQVTDSRPISVSLGMQTSNMNELVVTALGIKKQGRAIGYATTEVPGGNFTQSRETNLANALTGQIAGVNVAGVGTGPSGSTRVVIRGNASLTGNNQPLYVIDGVALDTKNQGSSGQWGGADYGDVLSTINPDDIESIQVLKGVAASALYGYRGGNGAILITTKSGSHTHGLGVEVNNNLTFNKVIDERDYQYTYGQGLQGQKPTTLAAAQAAPNFSWGGKLDGSQAVNFLGNSYGYTAAKDNFENFYKTGVSNQTSVALLGNNGTGHFRLGLSNLYMNTVIPNSDMKQQGVNFNSAYDITRKLHLNLTADYVFERVKNRVSFSDAPGNVVASVLYLANSVDVRLLKPMAKTDGSEMLPGTDQYFNNPYFVAYKFQNHTDRNRLTGGLTLKYDLTDFLSVQGQVTRNGTISDVVQITPSGTGYNPGGNLTQYTRDFRELNGNFMVEFNKKFGEFSVHANVGGNSQDNVTKIGGVGAVHTPVGDLQSAAGPFVVPFFYSSSNVSEKPYGYYYEHYRVNSLYGSADLGFRNFLFVTVTARNDWFSTLNIHTDHVLYPSVSGSFVFSDVVHMPAWISYGKLRASYARSSNGTDPYKNLLTYTLQGYTINDQTVGSITQVNVPNNFLKPVNISEQEIGLSMQFLDSRVGIDVAIYNKRTKDDILPVTISPTSGYTGNYVNIGKLRNRGIELLLTGTPVKTRNFSWDASFNIATNDNKVLALSPGINQIVIDGAFPRWGNGVSVQNIVGKSYAQIVGYAYKRDPGGNIVYGADGLPLHSDEVVPLGSGIYKTTGGFNNDLHYKSFKLSFLFDFKYGAKIYSGTNLLLYNYGLQKTTLQGREGGYVGPGVTADGHNNTVSVPAQTYWQAISTGANHVAEEFVYDASFIKFRSISLAYNLPSSVLKKAPFIQGLTLSLVGRNIATLMKHTPNIDPESNLTGTNAQGLELSGYPAVRNLGFNINVKF